MLPGEPPTGRGLAFPRSEVLAERVTGSEAWGMPCFPLARGPLPDAGSATPAARVRPNDSPASREGEAASGAATHALSRINHYWPSGTTPTERIAW
jgi:hypothetical protein